MARMVPAGKVLLLAFVSFLLAASVSWTPAPRSYALAVIISVILCPAALGAAGARLLRLGPWATVGAINALPVLSALDDALRLHAPILFRWVIAAALFSWAGWRLGSGLLQRPDRDAPGLAGH